jgi:hypothetical protein
MKCCTCYLVLALLFGAATLAPTQEKEKKGKLGDFAGDYEKGKKDKKENKDEKNCSDESDDGGWLGFLVHIFFSPDGDNKDSTGEARESSPPKPAPYPYRDDRGLPIHSPDYREYSLLAEAGYLHLGKNLSGFQLAGDFRAYRFAANLDLHTLVEDLGRRNQSLTFFGLNGGYEVIATPYLLARPYVGARNLSGLGLDLWGPEIGAKMLMLPRKPINIEANISHARINGKPLTIAGGSLGVMIKRVELRLGGQMFRSEWTTLEGVKVGFRVWL